MYITNSYRIFLIIHLFYGYFVALKTYGGQMSGGNLSYYLFFLRENSPPLRQISRYAADIQTQNKNTT